MAPCSHFNGILSSSNFINLRLLYRPARAPAPIAAFNKDAGSHGIDDGSNAMSSNSTNSFLRHPAIAQREALRQFYLSTCPKEQLTVIEISKDYLDSPTSLHMMCHLAELSLKGQLEGDAASQDAILHALYNSFDDLTSLPSQSIGAVLWSMASVQQNQREDSSNAGSQTQINSCDNNTNWKVKVVEKGG